MTANAHRPATLVALSLSMGVVGGLIEGGVHMLLQRLHVLDNSWYQIIWIAALFNGLLLAGIGGGVALLLTRLPQRRALGLSALFAITGAACLPWMTLLLKEWIEPYAILLLVAGTTGALVRWLANQHAAIERFARPAAGWAAAAGIASFVTIQGGLWLSEQIGTRRLPAAAPSAPDILLIIIDTLRADHLSSYGYSRPTTPNVDKLAAEGVVFENAFSTSSYTLPSHASILSGLYSREHGVEWDTSHDAHRATFAVLPEVLQQIGYRTGAFSANTFYFAREHGFGRGFLHFEDYFHSVTDMVFRTAVGGIATRVLRRVGFEDHPGRKRAPDVTRAALKWADGGARDHPSFIVLNYIDAHDPYLPPEPYRSRFSKQPSPGGLINSKVHSSRKLGPAELQGEIDAYDGAISLVDEQIGVLVDALRQRRAPRDLLVILTSDHGEEFGEHGHYLHGKHLYREVIRVPLIVWQPGRVPAGVRVTRPVSNAAVPATTMHLLGTGQNRFPGEPLQHAWSETAAAADWPLPLSDLKHSPWTPDREPVHHGSLRSVVSARLHYIENDGLGPELFDWRSDPGETHNLVSQPGMEQDLRNLRARLK